MQTCPKCNNGIPDDSRYCPVCSTRNPIYGDDPTIKKDVIYKKHNNLGRTLFIFLGIALTVTFVYFAATNSNAYKAKRTESQTITLHGMVVFTGTQFVITNSDGFDWTNVELSLNPSWHSYKFTFDELKAGESCTIGAAEFSQDDGKRFDPFTYKPKVLLIKANTVKGEGDTGFEFK